MFNSIRGLTILFVLIAVSAIALTPFLTQHGISAKVVSWGNVLMYVMSTVSVYLLSRGLKAHTTAGFLQNTYGSILLKLFACAIAVFIYLYTSKGHISKRALFVCMALYIVYTFAERRIIINYSKAKKNEDRASAAGIS